MSGDRVLSAALVRESIQRFQQVVNGPLLEPPPASSRQALGLKKNSTTGSASEPAGIANVKRNNKCSRTA